uniref:DNA annealing helicase and endonuclease ZRANB3 isoform X2 n=1 Tax=Myxine glutinosa TaxID=7769 RepID=UPI00358EC9D4
MGGKDQGDKKVQAGTSGADNKFADASSADKRETEHHGGKMQQTSSVLARLPRPLLDRLLPFQREGVLFAVRCDGRCLIADEMGLGKTLQAIAVACYYQSEWPLLVVVPSSIKYSWLEELERWVPGLGPADIRLVESKTDIKAVEEGVITVLGYGLLTAESPLVEALKHQRFGVAIVDESHYMKTRTAARSRVLKPLVQAAKRAVLLSGTPALARPAELFMQVDAMYPSLFGTWFEYSKRYCNGHMRFFGSRKKQWDCNGASNLAELHERLNTIMIRRLKKDVLTQLPPKIRQRILFDVPKESSKELLESLSMWRSLMRQLKEGDDSMNRSIGSVFGLMAHLFQQTAIAKAGAVKEYIKMLLQCSSVKFLVFANHLVMLKACTEAVAENKVQYIRIDGSVPSFERAHLVKKFQSDPEVRVAILSIQAAGQGLTLTAAEHVVFAELYWDPGHMQQAEDRAHRIGQHNSVQVHYLVARGTLDTTIWAMLNRKVSIISSTLDGHLEKLSVAEAQSDKYAFLSEALAWEPDVEQLNAEGVFFSQRGKQQPDIRTFLSTSQSGSPDLQTSKHVLGSSFPALLGQKRGSSDGTSGSCELQSTLMREPEGLTSDQWTCKKCTFSNTALLPYCEMCETSRRVGGSADLSHVESDRGEKLEISTLETNSLVTQSREKLDEASFPPAEIILIPDSDEEADDHLNVNNLSLHKGVGVVSQLVEEEEESSEKGASKLCPIFDTVIEGLPGMEPISYEAMIEPTSAVEESMTSDENSVQRMNCDVVDSCTTTLNPDCTTSPSEEPVERYENFLYCPSCNTDRIFLFDRETERLLCTFSPLDVRLQNWDELPNVLRNQHNFTLVKRFVRDWDDLSAMKQRLLRKNNQLLQIPTITAAELLREQQKQNCTKRFMNKSDLAAQAKTKAKQEGGSVRLVTRPAMHERSYSSGCKEKAAEQCSDRGYLQALDSAGRPFCLYCQKVISSNSTVKLGPAESIQSTTAQRSKETETCNGKLVLGMAKLEETGKDESVVIGETPKSTKLDLRSIRNESHGYEGQDIADCKDTGCSTNCDAPSENIAVLTPPMKMATCSSSPSRPVSRSTGDTAQAADVSEGPATIAWHNRFCSEVCRQSFSLRAHGLEIRKVVCETEYGVCQACGLDAQDLFKRVRDAPHTLRKELLQQSHMIHLPVKQLNDMVRHPYAGQFWQADHVRPVWNGGGQCSLANLQTLCTPCHLKKTVKQEVERKQMKKLSHASRSGMDITLFFAPK